MIYIVFNNIPQKCASITVKATFNIRTKETVLVETFWCRNK